MSSKLYPDTENIHWQGDGPAIVLIHGWGMNSAVWQQLTEALVAAGLCVGVVDLPGFGGTPRREPSDNIDDWVSCLWQQIPANCHLLGWSLGGLVATKMALTEPQRSLSLCTIASSPCFEQQTGWPGIKPNVLANFASQLQTDIDATIRGFFALQGMGSSSARADVRNLQRAVMAKPQADSVALAGALAMLKQVDLRAEIAAIQLPWLRIYGRNDALVPKAVVAPVTALAPSSQLLLIDGAGHAPFISCYKIVCKSLIEFYTSRDFGDTLSIS